jgi:hypothetical protein
MNAGWRAMPDIRRPRSLISSGARGGIFNQRCTATRRARGEAGDPPVSLHEKRDRKRGDGRAEQIRSHGQGRERLVRRECVAGERVYRHKDCVI